jgi:hypothetical protein
MEKGFFHSERGYWQTIDEPSAAVLSGYPSETIEVPIRPSSLHTWNGSGWDKPSQEVLAKHLDEEYRYERNYRLIVYVDPVVSNPLRWNDMSLDQRQALANYRQQLLDVPQQPGYPFQIQWPENP